MRPVLFFVTAVLLAHLSYSQRGDELIRTVLKKNERNKVFVFDSSNKKRVDGYYKIYITYLGNVKTNDTIRKIVIVETEFGTTLHTSGTVFVYDKANRYYGKYSLGDGLDLPSRIEKNKLIFINKYKKESCDPKLITTIDFSKGIPKKVFLKCKGEYGDVYSFSTKKD